MNDAIRMQISAFVDGELPDAEADLLLRRMSQDTDLRRKVAEYLEIGRVMRGEPGMPGVAHLQERIAAAIDDRPVNGDVVSPDAPTNRALRPLAGIAVAASVALVALFGLQMPPGADDLSEPAADALAEAVEDAAYTVPGPIDDRLRQYYLSHGASSSELGANGMNTRLVTLRLSDEAFAEDEEKEEEPDAEPDEDGSAQP